MRGLSFQNRKLLAKRQVFQEQVTARTDGSSEQNEQKPQQAGHESVVAEFHEHLTVGFAAMMYATNFNGVGGGTYKKEPVIANA